LISNSKCDLDNFLSLLELVLRDMLIAKQNLQRLMFNPSAYQRVKNAQGFSIGALINAIESVEEAQKRKKFNANPTMLIEWVLFQILEGKYIWQKL
jgi:DNA polymerase III gamma/tau subunit